MRNQELPVTVDNHIKCTLGNKQRNMKLHVTADVQEPSFKNDAGNIVYMLPPNFSIIDKNNHNHLKI